jgi:hypothetical protein
MQLPYTSNSLLAWIDPSEKYVLRDKSNNLISVVERLSDIPLTSDVGAAPTWADNVINGRPAFTFAGAQNLRFNFNRSAVSVGTKKPIVMMAVAKTTTFPGAGGTLFDLGSLTNANAVLTTQFLSSGGNKVQNVRLDDASAADSGNVIAADTSFHLYTLIYDGTKLKLRVDGTQVDSITVTATGSFDGDQLSIGDYTVLAAGNYGHAYLTGKVATVLMYEGANGDVDLSPETWLKQYYGL